jgi:hypothetical protein
MAYKSKPCVGCGGPKPKGRGLRYCASCERKPEWRFGQQPCRACGSTENKQPGRQYCDECKELRIWRERRRESARAVTKKKPCVECGGIKRRGRGTKLCGPCKAKREQKPPRICAQCPNPSRGRGYLLCLECAERSRERQRARNRAYQKRRKQAAPELILQQKRAERERRLHDPATHARDLERRRMRYRLKHQSAGRTMRAGPVSITAPESRASLPARPIAAVIDQRTKTTDLVLVCELIGFQERQVSRWRNGELATVSADDADRVMTALDLFWWEVFTEDTVRLPVLVVTTYQHAKKNVRGKTKVVRNKMRTLPYGDQGPDHERLSQIRALMSGEAIAA